MLDSTLKGLLLVLTISILLPMPYILLKFEKCLCVCLRANSSAVYGPMGTKLGREVGGRHEKHLAKTNF